MLSCTSASARETMELGRGLAALAQAGDVVVLTGDLGAGKTQFAKGFAAGLGVDDEVTSPTFTIMIEYVGDELPLLHFDLYRLEDAAALEDIDYFGMLESGAVCLVEWGDKFPEALPADYLEVSFSLAVADGIASETGVPEAAASDRPFDEFDILPGRADAGGASPATGACDTVDKDVGGVSSAVGAGSRFADAGEVQAAASDLRRIEVTGHGPRATALESAFAHAFVHAGA